MRVKDKNAMEHMKMYCLEIEETMELFGKSYDEFQRNKIYRNAAVMCILQIGELVTHLSEEFLLAHTEMPWRDMKNMRNIAAHNYGVISAKLTWGTMVERIPQLLAFCQQVLEEDPVEKAPQ